MQDKGRVRGRGSCRQHLHSMLPTDSASESVCAWQHSQHCAHPQSFGRSTSSTPLGGLPAAHLWAAHLRTPGRPKRVKGLTPIPRAPHTRTQCHSVVANTYAQPKNIRNRAIWAAAVECFHRRALLCPAGMPRAIRPRAVRQCGAGAEQAQHLRHHHVHMVRPPPRPPLVHPTLAKACTHKTK